MKKIYPVFGILAPLFYVFAVIIGGFSLEGYNHIYNTISELTASNAPKNSVVMNLFHLYNVALILFAAGAFCYLETNNKKKTKISMAMLIVVGLLGIGMNFFPQDPRNIEMTINGKIHIILAGVCSLLTMVLVILSGVGFKDDAHFKKLRIYSYISFVIIFVTGGTSAISVGKDSAYGGLFERLTIGTFILWVLVIAIKIFLNNKNMKISNSAEYKKI